MDRRTVLAVVVGVILVATPTWIGVLIPVTGQYRYAATPVRVADGRIVGMDELGDNIRFDSVLCTGRPGIPCVLAQLVPRNGSLRIRPSTGAEPITHVKRGAGSYSELTIEHPGNGTIVHSSPIAPATLLEVIADRPTHQPVVEAPLNGGIATSDSPIKARGKVFETENGYAVITFESRRPGPSNWAAIYRGVAILLGIVVGAALLFAAGTRRGTSGSVQ
ncbi:MAG: hypothetical protein ABEJ57_02235 [Halobacteriaceae archaeon]